jgi:hypothetical protein
MSIDPMDSPAKRTPTEFTRWKWEWLEQVMYDPDLLVSAKIVGFCIMQHVNFGTCSAWPAIRRIAALTNLGKATVADGTSLLKLRGYLEIDYGQPGRGHSHIYRPTLKVRPTGHLTETQKSGPPDNRVPHDSKCPVSKSEMSGLDPEMSGLVPVKVRPTGQNTYKNTLKNTGSLNTHRAQARGAHAEEDRQRLRDLLSECIKKRLIDEPYAQKLTRWLDQLLDAIGRDEITVEQAKTDFDKVIGPLIKQVAEPSPPGPAPVGQADGSAREPASAPRQAEKRPPREEPSKDQLARDRAISAVWKAFGEGQIDEARAQQRINEINSAQGSA